MDPTLQSDTEHRVLVTFASKYGSTQAIAEAVASSLRQEGLTVDVARCKDVKDLAPYTAVVMGSAVYVGRWRREAADLLRQGEAHLARVPVWLFSSGPTGEGEAEELLQGWHFPSALQGIADRIGPRDIAVFHGALDKSRLNPFDAFIVRNVKAPLGDFRDLDAVAAWARSIGAELQQRHLLAGV